MKPRATNWCIGSWLPRSKFAAQRYARGRLLDVGCGAKPWRDQFAPHVAEHIGADRADSLHGLRDVDLISDVYDIPLQDGSV